jgi:hypothetical protein
MSRAQVMEAYTQYIPYATAPHLNSEVRTSPPRSTILTLNAKLSSSTLGFLARGGGRVAIALRDYFTLRRTAQLWEGSRRVHRAGFAFAFRTALRFGGVAKKPA